MKRRQHNVLRRLQSLPWRKIGLITLGVILGGLLLLQLVFPSDRLLPFASIDGVSLGWKTKAEATKTLEEAYRNRQITFQDSSNRTIAKLTPKDLALTVRSNDQVTTTSYPWYMRLIPTSLFWVKTTVSQSHPTVSVSDKTTAQITEKIVPKCNRDATNATIAFRNKTLDIVEAKDGSSCQVNAVVEAVKAVELHLATESVLALPAETIKPTVPTDSAKKEQQRLLKRLEKRVSLKVNDAHVTIPAETVYSWLEFSHKDEAVITTVSAAKAQEYFNKEIAPKVAIAAGTSKVTTRDFVEVSRQNGATGRALDLDETANQLTQYVQEKSDDATVVTKAIQPKVEYTRSYSATDAGLSALLKHYAEDHSGTYGISLIELSGKRRSANYNGDKQFVTASTYKLFVAYSLLKRVDDGSWSWASNEVCFNKMISLSDNACAESFLQNIGLANVTKDIQGLGLTQSTFMKSGGPYTTANDLAKLMGMIESGQGFSAVNRDRLIAALKANVYRNGIPAGVNGTVADKVGFLNGLLHDSAIVYSPQGTYVLVIMTDGSSWGTIADLAKQIDQLHAQ